MLSDSLKKYSQRPEHITHRFRVVNDELHCHFQWADRATWILDPSTSVRIADYGNHSVR